MFYEGPPTANGRPGIHHVFSRTIKDLICRYHAMQGKSVTRIAGWDTHGLPVEIEVEKELGSAGRRTSRSFGVAEFNARARESVFRYQADWERSRDRIGYWLDYEHPYITCSNEYIETRLVAAATPARERPAVPRPPGAAVLPALRHGAVEPRAGAGLRGGHHQLGVRHLSRWPTDPARAAARVDDDAVDAAVERGGGRASRSRVRRVSGGRPPARSSATARAAALPSSSAQGRADLRRARRRAHASRDASWSGCAIAGRSRWCRCPRTGPRASSSPGDFVTAEDGSGLVHMAPAFGADDYQAGTSTGWRWCGRSRARRHLPGTSWPEIEGRLVTARETNDLIIQRLKQDGRWHLTQPYTHTYPHCWRCGSPLHLLRARLVVRAHVGVQGADAGAQPRGRLASARGRRRAGSASGWRTTSTGRSRATATGARRCRCGSATATRRTWT